MSPLFFWSTVIRRAIYIYKERKKESAHASQYLSLVEQRLKGSFDQATRRKVVVSHSIYNPMVVDAFCALHGRASTGAERVKLINYFIVSSLADNFFDEKELTYPEIEAITKTPGQYAARNFDEAAFIQSHTYLINEVKNKPAYLALFDSEIRAQQHSLKQFDKSVSTDELQSIMTEKGGTAVLMCRHYLDVPASETEDHIWFQLGVMIQLTNDLFDIYKDIREGIETLAVRCRSAFEMEAYVEQKIADLLRTIDQLSCSRRAKQQLTISLACVCAFSLVAVDQLKRLQGNKAELPHFPGLPRKQLIIDMEKPANIFRWFRFVYKIANTNYKP